jgi:hypothetical protein
VVAERVHETKLAPEIIFDALKSGFSNYRVIMQNSNKLVLQLNDGKSTHIIDITANVFENLNQIRILSTSTIKGIFSSSTSFEEENSQANFGIKVLVNLESEMNNLKIISKNKKISDSQQTLVNSVKIVIPTHMESDTQSSLIFEIKNTSHIPITNFHITFPDIDDFFSVSGELKLGKILPGMEIEHSFTVKPKFQKGTFPFNVMIHGNDVSVILNYFIKIGGTEIY